MKQKLLILFLCFLMIKAMGQVDSATMRYNNNGNVSWLDLIKPSTTSENNAADFLKTFLANNSVDVNFNTYFDEVDNQNFRHQKFKQTYKGVEVYNGQYFVHSRNGFIETANGNYIPVSLPSVTPGLTESQALTYALNDINAVSYMWQNPGLEAQLKQNQNNPNATYYPVAQLVIVPKNFSGLNNDILAYMFDVACQQPSDDIKILVDANTGSIIKKNSMTCHSNVPGTAFTQFSGNASITCNQYNASSFKLEVLYPNGSTSKKIVTSDFSAASNATGSTIFPSVYVNTNTTFDNTWLNNNPDGLAALDAHWAAEKTFSFWENVLGRQYLNPNNHNQTLQVDVHFKGTADIDGAEWKPLRNEVVFGDGLNVFKPLVSLDIVSHEMGHALATYTAQLDGSGGLEARAIGEALSDIWGACVENYANQDPSLLNKKDIWVTGEEILKKTGGLNLPFYRSFIDPTRTIDVSNNTIVTNLPDCYLSQDWNNLQTRGLDGEHYACGVINKWFYLLCNGGTGINAVGGNYNITGLATKTGLIYDFTDVINILYTAEKSYLPIAPSFMDLRDATIKACVQLYGGGSSKTCTVMQAWYAVNIGTDCPPIQCDLSSYTIIGGVYATPINNGGNYYVNSTTTIQGNVSFSNTNFVLQNGATIIVDDLATLTLKGCHFKTCNGMWNGIKVKTTGKLILDDYIGKSNLIEDANTAVYYNGTSQAANSTSGSIDIENTIFNRNNIGIKIENYNLDNAGTFPFSVKNCIFTSRQITSATGVWDNVATIKGGAVSGNYNSTFISNATYPDNVATAYLKDVYTTGYTTKKPVAGIMLVNTGSFDGLAYHRIIIGDNSSITNANVFDNVDYGIKAEKACLNVTNCVFQKPNPNNATPNTNAIGIYVDNESGKYIYNGTNHPMRDVAERSVEITTPNTGDPSNTFFDMNTAIKIIGSQIVNVNNCDIRSTQSITDLANKKGSFGIYIKNSYCEKIDVLNNNLYNIRNGIYVANSVAYQDLYPKFGELAVSENHIYRDLAGATDATGNEYVNNAITLECLVSGNDLANKTLTCSGNTINNSFNGIRLTGWLNKNVQVVDNLNIKLVADPINTSAMHYGIKIEGGTPANDANGHPISSLVRDNRIDGTSNNNKISGIHISLQTNTTIDCNKVNNCQDGFRFHGDCTPTKFTDNFIYFNNKNGLYLDATVIGTQGNNGGGVLADVCTSNNDWEQPAGTWRGNGKNMIYNNNSNPTQSEFVVRGNGRFNPALGGSASVNSLIYDVSNGVAVTTDPDGGNCTSNRCSGAPKRVKNVQEVLEEIAAGTILLPDDEAQQRLEVMQQQLYELVKAQPELAANSTDIQQFIYDNHWQSLDFIHYLGYFAAQGNMNQVDNILNYWLPTSSELDDNYRTYYEWLTAMYNNPEYKPSPEEVLPYANKCPIKNGTIIYAIRNLYNALTETINNFEDNCENNAQSRGTKRKVEMVRLKQPKVKQSITSFENKLLIYPNPVSNVLNIATTNIKTVEITDIMGKVVMQKNISSISKTSLPVSELQKGIYIIKVINLQGKTSIAKFIKE